MPTYEELYKIKDDENFKVIGKDKITEQFKPKATDYTNIKVKKPLKGGE